MGRHREFEPTEALQSALMVFWRQGYAATSIDDIVGATGVSRYGLYSAFGDAGRPCGCDHQLLSRTGLGTALEPARASDNPQRNL